MTIDVKRFIETVEEEITGQEVLPNEVVMYAPVLVEQAEYAYDKMEGDDEMANVLIGRRILAHSYGELMAIKFRRWVEENYEIGCDDREWSAPPTATITQDEMDQYAEAMAA